MAAKSTRAPAGDAVFFAALKSGYAVRTACILAGYARSCVYSWRRDDPRFAAAWRSAIVASLEAEADRRLRARYERPVVYRGEIVGVRRTCPDALLFARYDALRRQRERALMAGGSPSAPARPIPPRAGRFARWFGWIARLLFALRRPADSGHAR